MIRNSNPASRYSCKHSLSSRESDLRDPCPTYCLPMPKSRGRKPKKKRGPASAPKKRLDNFNTTPQAPVIDPATPRAAVGNGATPRAAHTKNKKDREAHNGCCPCGHRDSPVCLCVYFDETMRGASSSAVGAIVTGRGCFPVGERGHWWHPESRPAVPSSGTHMCTARQRHCLSLRRHRRACAAWPCSCLRRRTSRNQIGRAHV